MAVGFMKRISPEYVLKCAVADIKTSGLDGLKPYLTPNALKKIEAAQTLSGGIGMLSGGMGLSLAPQDPGGDAATALVFMLNNLSGIDWSIRDVLKGSDTAKGIVGFRFEDSMEGTVELTLIRLEKEWRIDNLNMPHFDRLSPHR